MDEAGHPVYGVGVRIAVTPEPRVPLDLCRHCRAPVVRGELASHERRCAAQTWRRPGGGA